MYIKYLIDEVTVHFYVDKEVEVDWQGKQDIYYKIESEELAKRKKIKGKLDKVFFTKIRSQTANPDYSFEYDMSEDL